MPNLALVDALVEAGFSSTNARELAPMLEPNTSIRSRCATRLYSTQISNSTTSVLTGYGFPGADTKVTHGFLADVETEFDAVSLIVHNTTASPLTWGNLKASSVRQVASANTNITQTLSGTFGGNTSVTVTAGTTTSPTLVVSDPIPLASVPRTDGGTRPLVFFTVETTTTTDGATQIGSWYRGGGDNTTKTHDGGRVLAAVAVTGSVAPSGMPMNSAGTGTASAIIGFVYWSRGAKVLTVMESGSSLAAGNTLIQANRGHLIRAVEAVSTKKSPIEYMVVGLPGHGIGAIRALTEKIVAQGTPTSGLLPGVLVFNAFDPNSNVGTSIDLAPMRVAASRIEIVAQRIGAKLVMVEGLPRQINSTTPAWNNDTERRKFNASLAGEYGAYVINHAYVFENAGNPSLFASGTVQGDFTHPTDTADNVTRDMIAAMLQKLG